MQDELVEDYKPTKADSYHKKVVDVGNEVQIDIWTQLDRIMLRSETTISAMVKAFSVSSSLQNKNFFQATSEFREQIL